MRLKRLPWYRPWRYFQSIIRIRVHIVPRTTFIRISDFLIIRTLKIILRSWNYFSLIIIYLFTWSFPKIFSKSGNNTFFFFFNHFNDLIINFICLYNVCLIPIWCSITWFNLTINIIYFSNKSCIRNLFIISIISLNTSTFIRFIRFRTRPRSNYLSFDNLCLRWFNYL